MKRLFSTLMMVMGSIGLFAQVNYFEGSLKEAFKKANTEDKLVIVMCSATWCGPCKKLETNVFTTEEAGNFFGNGYVFKKYYIDKDDPENLHATYKIPGFPSFLIFDGKGEFLGQAFGGAVDAKLFTSKIAEVTAKGNTLPERYARLEADLSYANEFIDFLTSKARLTLEADKVIAFTLNRVDLKEQLTASNLKKYGAIISSMDSPTLKFFLENKKRLISAIGKEEYETFLFNQSSRFLMNQIAARSFNQESFDDTLTFIKKYKLGSDYQDFIIENMQLIRDKNYTELYKLGEKAIRKCDTNSRQAIINACGTAIPKNGFFIHPDHSEVANKLILSILETAYACEKDAKAKESYKAKIEKAKNS